MKKKLWPFLYRLHRYMGLLSALVLIMLAVTGIALNHTEDLKLDSHKINSNAILDWYGIPSPQNLKSFATLDHWLTQVNQNIYFDKAVLIKTEENLLGSVETDEFIVAALSNSLLLLSVEGELIEQTPLNNIKRIGLNSKKAVVIIAGEEQLSSNDGLLSWHSDNNKTVTWSKNTILPESIKKTIQSHFRSSILPLERVLLDIHSGRFFGMIGVIIVDISGIFVIILSLSGLAIWLRRKLIVLKRS